MTPPPAAPGPSAPPLGRRVPPWVWRLVNTFTRTLLRLPFPTPLGKQLMLVHLTGRTTGRHYRQPVSYVRHGATLLTPGGGRWKHNLVPGRPVKLRIHGHDQMADPEIVGDPEAAADLLAVMIAANPTVSRFSGIHLGADGRPDPSQLGPALEHGFAVVRWHLSTP